MLHSIFITPLQFAAGIKLLNWNKTINHFTLWQRLFFDALRHVFCMQCSIFFAVLHCVLPTFATILRRWAAFSSSRFCLLETFWWFIPLLRKRFSLWFLKCLIFSHFLPLGKSGTTLLCRKNLAGWKQADWKIIEFNNNSFVASQTVIVKICENCICFIIKIERMMPSSDRNSHHFLR